MQIKLLQLWTWTYWERDPEYNGALYIQFKNLSYFPKSYSSTVKTWSRRTAHRSYEAKGADVETLREPDPSETPTGLLDNLRRYRLRTDARFSFPFGKATSPAAVPDRPFRQEIAISTSLIMSRSIAAVVHFPLAGFAAGGNIPFERGGLNLCCAAAGTWRQKQGVIGDRGFENAASMIPWKWKCMYS